MGARAVADGAAPPAAAEPVHRHARPAADRAGHLQPAVPPAPAGCCSSAWSRSWWAARSPGRGSARSTPVVAAHVTLTAVFFGVVVPDFADHLRGRRCWTGSPGCCCSGVFFPSMRMLDAAIGLYAIPGPGCRGPTGGGRARPVASRSVVSGPSRRHPSRRRRKAALCAARLARTEDTARPWCGRTRARHSWRRLVMHLGEDSRHGDGAQ